MALRDLVDGECGRTNSLVHLSSHFVHDRAHKEDGLCHSAYSHGDADELVQQFLGETLGNSPQTFRMDSLLQEMREIESSVSLHAPVPAPGIAALATSDPTSLAVEDSSWAQQYLESGKQFDEEPREAEIWSLPPEGEEEEEGGGEGEGVREGGGELSSSSVAEAATSVIAASGHQEVFELGFGPHWAQDYLQSSQPNVDLDENWLEHSVDTPRPNELQETANQLLHNVTDANINASKFMKFMQQIRDREVTITDGEVRRVSDGEIFNLGDDEVNNILEDKVVRNEEELNIQEANKLYKKDIPVSSEEIWNEAAGGTESTSHKVRDGVDLDEYTEYSKNLWSKLQDEWEKIFKNKEMADQPWVSEFSDYYDPFKDYPFEGDNPMKDNSQALEEGKKRLAEGDLASAVLCFEAAVLNEPENSEAWELLGITQAENEQDPPAISALKNCLKLDPGNLKALMALAVSYTNESYQNQACIVLREWLRQNEKYSHLAPNDEMTASWKSGVVSSFLTQDTHKEVQNLYITAARLHPTEDIDADIQCGLGVLFNLSNEYDKAVDCFRTALQVKPQDSRIWNRLGATLANGDRSVEAVEAYDQALKLSPGYIRARYNLGITCLNLGAYKEAAEHLLLALNQQAQARGFEKMAKSWSAMSDNIWSTLRLVVSLLDRRDLHDAVDSRNLLKLNEAFNVE